MFGKINIVLRRQERVCSDFRNDFKWRKYYIIDEAIKVCTIDLNSTTMLEI